MPCIKSWSLEIQIKATQKYRLLFLKIFTSVLQILKEKNIRPIQTNAAV